MRTIKDPPDEVSGFTGGHYTILNYLCDLDSDSNWIVRNSINVQITSQVERTELDELAVEESDSTDTGHSEDYDKEGHMETSDTREHTSGTSEDAGDMGPTLGTHSIPSDEHIDSMATTTGDDDQEDTSKSMGKGDTTIRHHETDDLDIQFVRVITT